MTETVLPLPTPVRMPGAAVVPLDDCEPIVKVQGAPASAGRTVAAPDALETATLARLAAPMTLPTASNETAVRRIPRTQPKRDTLSRCFNILLPSILMWAARRPPPTAAETGILDVSPRAVKNGEIAQFLHPRVRGCPDH